MQASYYLVPHDKVGECETLSKRLGLLWWTQVIASVFSTLILYKHLLCHLCVQTLRIQVCCCRCNGYTLCYILLILSQI